MPSSMPRPARRIGTSTIGFARIAPVDERSGVSISISSVFQLREASTKRKTDNSWRCCRKVSGVVCFARKIDRLAATSGWSLTRTLSVALFMQRRKCFSAENANSADKNYQIETEIMDNRLPTGERRSWMTGTKIERRYPIGAELIGDGRVHFRVWAPKAKQLEVAIDGKFHELESEPGGYFSGAAEAKAGTLYRFRLNGEENLYPDPASRFQPQGSHGPSCVVDHRSFKWTDDRWKGTTLATDRRSI